MDPIAQEGWMGIPGFDRERMTWEPDLPVLFLAGEHVVSICNNKLNEISVTVDQIDPSKGITDFMDGWKNWGGKWDMEWRECLSATEPFETVSDIVPCIEGERRLNGRQLNGIALVSNHRAIAVLNGIDGNLPCPIDNPVFETRDEGAVLVCRLTGPSTLQES